MKWEVFDRFYNAHWMLTGFSCRNFPRLLKEAGVASPKIFAIMENDVNAMIFESKQFDSLGSYLSDRMIHDQKWRIRLDKQHAHYTNAYFRECQKIARLNLRQLNAEGLVAIMRKLMALQQHVRELGTTLNGLPLDGRNHLSNKLRGELRKFISEKDKFETYWTILTQVTRFSLRQTKDMAIAKLAAKVKSIPRKTREARLKKIYERYAYLDYMYYGPVPSLARYRKDLREAAKDNKHLRVSVQLKRTKNQQRELQKKLKFNSRARFIVKLAQHVLWQKGWRKDVEYHGFYRYEKIFREIARRMNVRDWRNLLYLLPWEFEDFVLFGNPDLKILEKRRGFSIFWATEHDSQLLAGGQARQAYQRLRLKQSRSESKQVQGQCAFAGRAVGRVRIIQVPADMKKMKQGDILLSQATSPDLLPAMKKAAAIVTNTGGLIAHAAITARELRIPCIVGTIKATEIFKDGDRVEVHADKGLVRLLNDS